MEAIILNSDPDLFEHAKRARDRGMGEAEFAEVLTASGFSEAAFRTIEWLARRQATVHVDDVLKHCPVQPSHPNAWGAVWMRAIRKGLIRRTGDVRPCKTDPKKHAHQYPVYQSQIRVP